MNRPSSVRIFLCIPLLVLGLLLSSPVVARPDDPADPNSGKDPAHYPPDRHFDFRHLRLDLDLGDMTAPRLNATATYTLAATGSTRSQVRLDARSLDSLGNGITIKSIKAKGRLAKFAHDNDRLLITLPAAAKPDDAFQLAIAYQCDYPANAGNGLTWSAGKPESDDPSTRAVMIHSQGQPEENRRWIPIHDFPNERLTTELFITVPDLFKACSNGRLVGVKPANAGRKTWHWSQERPHAPYLIMLAVGDFAQVDLGGPNSERPGLPMTLWVNHKEAEQATPIFAETAAMVAFFEAYFDEPYPWAKYDQLVVRDFRWGGMENTSATTLYPSASQGEPGSQDDLIAHELAHQWTGDLLTCKSWEHTWLNEGWASYSEALWAEWDAVRDYRAQNGGIKAPTADSVLPETMDPEARAEARRAYQRVMLRFLGPQRAMNRTFAPDTPAMASRIYPEPDYNFTKANDVYGKGALVLHMLRQRLGNELFVKGVRLYIDRFRDRTVETDDFRKCLEEVSGQSLERFFDQWVRRPGLPELEYDFAWDDAAKKLKVTAHQTQKIDNLNPAYALVVPIYIKLPGGEGRYVYLDTDIRSRSIEFSLPAKPEEVSVDPNLTIAGSHRVRTPLAMNARGIPSDIFDIFLNAPARAQSTRVAAR
jgi:aminopeptidase N